MNGHLCKSNNLSGTVNEHFCYSLPFFDDHNFEDVLFIGTAVNLELSIFSILVSVPPWI